MVYREWGFPKLAIVENQMDKNMDEYMETTTIEGFGFGSRERL